MAGRTGRRRSRRGRGKGTPPGTHVPVMVRQVLRDLAPQPGETVADCTLGYAGHSIRLAEAVGREGQLVGFDVDAEHLPAARRRLSGAPCRVHVRHADFARLGEIMTELRIRSFDLILADLGASSMQIDDPARGVGYAHDGPLDMRMDRSAGPTAAGLLETLDREELARALSDLGDEPDAGRIAQWIVNQRQALPITTTRQLARLVLAAKGLTEKTWRKSPRSRYGKIHPAALTFQTLRILVNREMESLEALLAGAPDWLSSGGRIGVISFHSGEDGRVKRSFRAGLETGVYAEISPKPLTPSGGEVHRNWRSASAKFRWARRAGTPTRP